VETVDLGYFCAGQDNTNLHCWTKTFKNRHIRSGRGNRTLTM